MESKDVRRILPNRLQLRFQIWKVRGTRKVQLKIPCKFKGLEGIQSFFRVLSRGFKIFWNYKKITVERSLGV